MRTGTKFLLVFAAIFILTPILRAADVQWPAKLGDWTADPSQASKSAAPSALSDALAKECGLISVSTKDYRAGGNRTIPVTLYQFKDSSGAYEAYDFLRARFGLMNVYNTLIIKGNVILRMWSLPENSPEFPPVVAWVNSVSDHVASPPIATYLPEKNKEFLTERYALGALGFQQAATELQSGLLQNSDGKVDLTSLAAEAGFESHAEAMLAKYKSGKDQATLLLIEYPTPQLAELHLRHLQRALADAKLTTSGIERKGSLLSIVLAPTSPEYADKLRSQVNYETSVTWNEPSQTATDPPIMSTVVKIFIATGVFMVVTIVIGIAFGGVRIITKRLFPGKVFDRKEQIEVLQLGLTGKPIDPTDLY
ncbi:MAG: hypothetical protein JO119_16225 [Acidobacteria bacterium]|nr:hypothetical protein [Acidobacteriota bacterium]